MENSNPKSYLIEINEENFVPCVIHRYEGNVSRSDRIIYHAVYDGQYIVHITEYDEGDAKKKAVELVTKRIKYVDNHGLDYDFPEFSTGSAKMKYGATLSRSMYIIDHYDRMKELVSSISPKDKWNWELLHSLKVTSQEYVVLFSGDAGDMYARGICNKYYYGEWKEEQYGDSFS